MSACGGVAEAEGARGGGLATWRWGKNTLWERNARATTGKDGGVRGAGGTHQSVRRVGGGEGEERREGEGEKRAWGERRNHLAWETVGRETKSSCLGDGGVGGGKEWAGNLF
jgi:hypothetical protein